MAKMGAGGSAVLPPIPPAFVSIPLFFRYSPLPDTRPYPTGIRLLAPIATLLGGHFLPLLRMCVKSMDTRWLAPIATPLGGHLLPHMRM